LRGTPSILTRQHRPRCDTAHTFAQLVTVIQGDDWITIGDGNVLWKTTFSTSARVEDEPAILTFNVRSLTDTNVDVVVEVNNAHVGMIRRYDGAR
jgi:hypothetical protein